MRGLLRATSFIVLFGHLTLFVIIVGCAKIGLLLNLAKAVDGDSGMVCLGRLHEGHLHVAALTFLDGVLRRHVRRMLGSWLVVSAGQLVEASILSIDLGLVHGHRFVSRFVHGHLFVATVLVVSLRLVADVEGVLREDVFTGHVQALEQQVGLHSRYHIILLLGDEVACLHFEVLLVLALGFFDVVAEGLLFDARSDHALLVVWQLLVGLGRAGLAVLAIATAASFCVVSFLEVLSVPQRCRTIEVGLESALHVWELALHAGVPVVLDGVVGAAFEDLGDLSPLVADDAVHQKEDPLFLFIPVNFLDSRVQVVVPALATLLAHAAVQVLRNQRPLLRAIGHHELEHTPVFFGGPGTLHVEWLAVTAYSLLGQIRALLFSCSGDG